MSLSSMLDIQKQSDPTMIATASNVDNGDMTNTDYEYELKRAKADALETAAALGNLVDGINAVKRILEQPIDVETSEQSSSVCQSPDEELVSKLSNQLIGVLGSDLIGLLNAAQMAKAHAKLRAEDDTKVVQELHDAREHAEKLNIRAQRAESMNLRLKAEKKLLVKEVRTLREDRQLLVKEVKSLRNTVHRTKQIDSWRLLKGHLRDATAVHESVLSHKTFKSGLDGVDPPGTKVTNDADALDINENRQEDDSGRSSPTSEKENKGHNIRISRKEGNQDDKLDKVLKYTDRKTLIAKAKANSTSPKQHRLSFGLGRFKNVLQEASDPKRDPQNSPEDQDQQLLSPKINNISEVSVVESNKNRQESDVSKTPTKLDDEATKSTVDISPDTSLFSDGEIPNDLALQISVDGDSSLMITPETSPLVGHSFKPSCNPNVLRTLSIPALSGRNTNLISNGETMTSTKPRRAIGNSMTRIK